MVQISDAGGNWQTVYRHDGSRWNVLDVPVGRSSRQFRLVLANHDALQLYEVEVWGRMP